ncbi:hypothetical protein [Kiloniella antarctica]|uniref:Uncharacterized protein n=1 Tax=Kiloniella antarctica TaxID=1550907 RepID=A0ABW5BHU2_9PROT
MIDSGIDPKAQGCMERGIFDYLNLIKVMSDKALDRVRQLVSIFIG